MPGAVPRRTAPSGALAGYSRAGDYSYGTYAYAFPIGQCISAAMPGASPTTYLLLTVPFTLALAIPSWHLLEEPLLRRKPRMAVEPKAAPAPIAATATHRP